MKELLLGLFGGFIVTEIHICLPALARWIVRRHLVKLPSELRERMEEEWLAEVEASPSHVQKVIFALGLLTGTTDLVRAHDEQNAPRVHGDVNVTLKGVSAVGSVGNVMPATIVIADGTSTAVSTVTGAGASLRASVRVTTTATGVLTSASD